MKIHSIIDVITNSSTEIYPFVCDGGIEQAYEMIEKIFKAGGINKKPQDVFDIHLQYDYDVIIETITDWGFDSFYDEYEDCDRGNEDSDAEEKRVFKAFIKEIANSSGFDYNDFLFLFEKYKSTESYSEQNKYAETTLIPYLQAHSKEGEKLIEWLTEYFEDDEYFNISSWVSIKPKDPSMDFDIFEYFEKIVHYEEVSC